MAENCTYSSSSMETKIEDENSVTMLDVLKEEEELEEDADAVLGGSDDKNCTYIQGYVKRQALYACLTCLPGGAIRAGVCLACSYHCHENHELVELYTKRNFRCDCGNSKFSPSVCKLLPDKAVENSGNSYTQNFIGLYCSCSRPYPDPDDSLEDEMIQCAICEDWFHGRHLGTGVPRENDFSEMTCGSCVQKHKFLTFYASCAVNCVKGEVNDKPSGPNVCDRSNKTAQVKPEKLPIAEGDCSEDVASSSPEVTSPCLSTSGCLLRGRDPPAIPEGALFWADGWRSNLCHCSGCRSMYEAANISFLLDEDDTVQSYEAKGKKVRTQYDRGMEALNSMGRVQQVEALHEYNNLKSQLMDYLKKFAENKKVVKEEDIREFFSGLEARKKQKTEVVVPHFCR